jgi:hypothetical protein
MNRRTFLASGVAAAAATAGCAFAAGESDLVSYVKVTNYTDAVHNVFVRIQDEEGTDRYRQQFRIPADELREERMDLSGDATTLFVTVDGRAPTEQPWPPAQTPCTERGARSAGGAELLLTDEGLTVDLGCDTLTPEA